MGPEATLQKKCVEHARKAGYWAAKFESPSYSGVPDFILVRSGQVSFVEFKAPGKHPTKLQLHTLRTLAEHGARVAVIDNFEAFKELMEL